MTAPNTPTQWRRVTSLADRECETCAHVSTLTSAAGVVHHHCRSMDVLEAMGRKIVSAGVARSEVCQGRQWRRRT
jgi:hypothetical protein